MAQFRWILCFALLGCGAENAPQQDQPNNSTQPGFDEPEASAWSAELQTPGFFRNLYRIQAVQASLDDPTAVARLLDDLPERIEHMDELPSILPVTEATIDALLVAALRSTQGNAEQPARARAIADALLKRILALDPARAAYNEANPTLPPQPASSGGPSYLAEAALEALSMASTPAGSGCETFPIENRANFSADEAVLAWVPERCQPDRFVGGYCEPDRLVEGDCVSEWVPEDCDGGGYETHGRYEYRCRSDGECYYEWRPRIQYVPGSCTGGYYEDYCYPDRYERGLCYDGTFVPGYCIPGRYEYRAPGGTWSWPSNALQQIDETACDAVWPAQRAVAVVSIGVLAETLADYVDPYWLVASLSALDTDDSQPDAAVVDVATQILEAVRSSDYESPQ